MSDPANTRRRPAVSVILPTYNHVGFVLSTLNSVFAQTFSDYEIIVVNDGSPDDTAHVLAPLAESGRIRYVEQANAGQAHARNRGISLARGEFIAPLDDDDLWPPDKLDWQVQALRVHPEAAVVYGKPDTIDAAGASTPAMDANGKPLWWLSPNAADDTYAAFTVRNQIVSPGQCLLRRSALDALDEPPFDASLSGCDDWDLWLRLAEWGCFVFEDRIALHYRLHAGNASRDRVQMRGGSLAVYRKHLRRNRNHPQRRALLAQTFFNLRWNGAEYWLGQALAQWRAGNRAAARAAARTGVALCPAYLASRSFRRLLRGPWPAPTSSLGASSAGGLT